MFHELNLPDRSDLPNVCRMSGSQNSWVQIFHQTLFSINMAAFSASLLFPLYPTAFRPFLEFEFAVKKLVGIRQTDLVTGYFAFASASLVGALCILILLRCFTNAAIARFIFTMVSGITSLALLPVYWMFVGWVLVANNHGVLYLAVPVELLVVLFLTVLLVRRRPSLRLVVLVVVIHYAFLQAILPGSSQLATYFGPIGLILGLLSGLSWAFYTIRTQ